MLLGDSASKRDGISRRNLAFGALAILIAGRGAAAVASETKTRKGKPPRFSGFQGSNSIALTIVSVASNVADHRSLDGGGLTVPVRISWQTEPWGNRVLFELKATLVVA